MRVLDTTMIASGRCRDRGGFTLLEVLTALVVAGVATTLFIQLYLASVDLAKNNRAERVALQLAREFVNEIVAVPQRIDWSKIEGPTEDLIDLGRIHFAEMPSTKPLERRAGERTKWFYEGFTVEASGRIPHENAQFVELVVRVGWQGKRRTDYVALTSAIPRSAAKGAGRP